MIDWETSWPLLISGMITSSAPARLASFEYRWFPTRTITRRSGESWLAMLAISVLVR